jgi:glycosyltransferase involved in cell wall biosynthesis
VVSTCFTLSRLGIKGLSKVRLLCVGRDLTGGGAERVQLTLLEHLDRDKFDIQVFYLSGQGTLHELVPSDITLTYGVPETESLILRAVPVLVRLIKLAYRCDVIFAMQEGTPIYLATVVGRLTGRPVVGWIHTPWASQLPNYNPWHRWASSLYLLTNKLIGVSEGVTEDLLRAYPRLRGKVTTIHNPLLLQRLQTQARAASPVWADQVFAKRTVLAAGRLAPEKGFDILLRAFAKLLQRGLDLHLLILGEGKERTKLEDMASRLGISNRVFMPGFQENPYPFFIRADVFVLSSRYEGLGIVLLEAITLGLPVVATDCPYGPREILKDGKYGILVPPEDATALAEAAYALIDSAERRAALGTADVALTEKYGIGQVRSFEDLLLNCATGGFLK